MNIQLFYWIQSLIQEEISIESFMDIIYKTSDTFFLITYENKTLLDFVISSTPTHQSSAIIDALLRRTLKNPALFKYLLLTPNQEGYSPYYQALCNASQPIEVAQSITHWLTFAVRNRFISKRDYANIHTAHNNNEQGPLYTLLSSNHTQQLEFSLQELQYGLQNNWLTEADRLQVLHQTDIYGYRLIDKALSSSNHKTIELMINYAGKDAFSAKANGETPLHLMAQNGQSKAMEICFLELNFAIKNGLLPKEIYSNILFEVTQYRMGIPHYLLSTSFHPNSGTTSQIILKYAEIARIHNWLTVDAYVHFLLQHACSDHGYSHIHEAVRSSDSDNFYAYIKYCLRAVINEEMSLNTFKNELLKENKAGYPLFNQAMNNDYLETAELVLNLFNSLFSDTEYSNALHKRVRREPRCDNDKVYSLEINTLVTAERHRMRDGKPQTKLIYYYTPSRELNPFLLELMESINIVLKYDAYERENASRSVCDYSPTGVHALSHSPAFFQRIRPSEEGAQLFSPLNKSTNLGMLVVT